MDAERRVFLAAAIATIVGTVLAFVIAYYTVFSPVPASSPDRDRVVKADGETPSQYGPAPNPKSVELAYWQSIADSGDPALYREYLRRYPNGEFADLARARIVQAERATRPQPSSTEPPDRKVTAGSTDDPAVPSETKQTMRSAFDVISFMQLNHPDTTAEPFPFTYLKQRLAERIGDRQLEVANVAIEIGFVEPRDMRRLAPGTSVVGFMMAKLPAVASCEVQFGAPRQYHLASVSASLMKAVDENVPAIAGWVGKVIDGRGIRCP